MAEKKGVSISEGIQWLWDALTNNQRRMLLAVSFVLLLVLFTGWCDSLSQRKQVRIHEREAAHAKADAAEAMKKAAAVAEEIRRKETNLKELEESLNEKILDLERAGRDSSDARREYDRIRSESRTTIPRRDELCRELADLGYPCPGQ